MLAISEKLLLQVLSIQDSTLNHLFCLGLCTTDFHFLPQFFYSILASIHFNNIFLVVALSPLNIHPSHDITHYIYTVQKLYLLMHSIRDLFQWSFREDKAVLPEKHKPGQKFMFLFLFYLWRRRLCWLTCSGHSSQDQLQGKCIVMPGCQRMCQPSPNRTDHKTCSESTSIHIHPTGIRNICIQ